MSNRKKIVFEPNHPQWAFFALCVFFFGGWFFAHLGPMAAWLTFAFSFVVYLLLMWDLLRWSIWPKELDDEIEESLDKGEDVFNAYAITYPFAFCGFFALCSFCVFKIYGEAAYANGLEGFQHWVMYLVDRVFRATFFDFAETFYIDLSKIEHQPEFLLCLFVFSFRTTAGISLLSLMIKTSRKVGERMDAPSDAQE